MSATSDLIDAGSVSRSSPAPRILGVVLDSYHVPCWVYYLIQKLISCKAIELSLVVLNSSSRVAAAADRGPILFRSWAAFDGWVRRSRTDALRLRDWRLLLACVRPIPVFVLRTGKPVSEADISPIKEAHFDLLLYLGRDALEVELSACARLGTWSLQQGALCEAAAVPGQFWDMYEGNRTIRYGPQVIERKQNQTRVAYSASGTTNFLSLALSQNAACWEIAEFLVTQLTDADRRADAQRRCEADPIRCSVARTLSNKEMTGFLVRWAMRVLRHELRKRLFREQWSIALQPKAGTEELHSAHHFRILHPPRDRFYADPFLIERKGRTYLFFEDYSFASHKGSISCCEVDAHGNCGKPRVVLEREYHLSYPFLFTWKGELYMIPETRDNRTIEVYRATDFPHSWVYEFDLMSDVSAADSTLLHYHDKWWLFTAGVRDHSSPDGALFLFFASSPLGPWTAHPKNPIVADPRHARPAGSLYFDKGQLIRPGQDCSNGYGYAAHLHRVDVLSETAYQETLLTSITPDWIRGSLGIHTFNQNAQFWALDCKFLISRFRLPRVLSAFQQTGSMVC